MHKLQSFPQLTGITSPNHGQSQRHACARTAFAEQFMNDPKIWPIFERWDKETGLIKLAAAVAVTSDHLSRALDLTDRGQLFEQEIAIDPQDYRATALHAELEKACIRLQEAVTTIPKTIYADAMRFAEEFSLPWWWICQELIFAFILQRTQAAVGIEFHVSRTVSPQPLDLRVNISTTTRELLDIFKATRPSRLAGRALKQKANSVSRNAVWFYRHQIGGVSISQLAREFHNIEHKNQVFGHDHDDRKLVKHGIQETRRLFNLSRHHISSTT